MNKFFLGLLTMGVLVSASAQPAFTGIRASADTIGLYDKLELSLRLKAVYTNPFDPDQIDITATFSAPSGKQWIIHGFYNYAMGTLWKVRFSPDESGVWRYTVHGKDKNGEAARDPKFFKAVPSPYPWAVLL